MAKKLCLISYLLLFYLISNQVFAIASLQKVQIKERDGKLSLYFALNQPVAHKAFTLTNPDRIVVDFANTELGFNLDSLHSNNGLLKLVRSGHPTPSSLRLVFEVRDPVQLNAFASAKPNRIFALDVSSFPNPKLNVNSRNQKPVKVASMPLKNLRNVVVVIDPGHGGHDPGALGPGRIQEKQVTLAIAQALKKVIDRQPGMQAVLTRNNDYYVGLRERLNIARHYNADVFVSIHADAYHTKESSGASVFALSQGGATSEAARWLAEKENYSELGGVNLKALDDDNGLVRTVLIDLSQTATISASLKIGGQVLGNLKQMTRLHDKRVDQARFMVLKSPDIPSILIETGFISNPREAKNLATPNYQVQLSEAICRGVKSYFWDYPPQGTRLEALTNQRILARHGPS